MGCVRSGAAFCESEVPLGVPCFGPFLAGLLVRRRLYRPCVRRRFERGHWSPFFSTFWKNAVFRRPPRNNKQKSPSGPDHGPDFKVYCSLSFLCNKEEEEGPSGPDFIVRPLSFGQRTIKNKFSGRGRLFLSSCKPLIDR